MKLFFIKVINVKTQFVLDDNFCWIHQYTVPIILDFKKFHNKWS